MWERRLRLMRICRQLSLSLTTAILLTLLAPQVAQANIPATFVFTGSGYGHGVGMSQIGARGMALESATATQILTHFYSGTEVAPVVDTQVIRINIGHKQSDAEITMRPLQKNQAIPPSITLIEGSLQSEELPSEEQVVGTYLSDLNLNLLSSSGAIEITRSSKTAKFAPLAPKKAWTVRWDSATVVQVRTKERTYLIRYGQIEIKRVKNSAGSGEMEIIASMRLGDEYLFGLGEVPSSWPAAALEAQAIAARTYALTKMDRIRSACDCNIYSTIRDQNFVGFSKESEAIYGIKWREAVERTRGLAVLLKKRPIQAFYFSSSGGMTQNVKDVWGSEFSYLVNRPDTWSVNANLNPRYAFWTRQVSQETMAKAFQMQDVDRYQILARSVTGSVLSVRAISSLGAEKILSGEVFRSRLGLPSTWINMPAIESPVPSEPEINPYGCVEWLGGMMSGIRIELEDCRPILK